MHDLLCSQIENIIATMKEIKLRVPTGHKLRHVLSKLIPSHNFIVDGLVVVFLPFSPRIENEDWIKWMLR